MNLGIIGQRVRGIGIPFLFGWLSLGLTLRGESGDLQLWNELKIAEYNSGPWRTFTWLEARYSDDISHLGVWMAQQKLYYGLSNRWEIGAGGSYLELKDRLGNWDRQTKLEFELNPRWELGNESVLAMRNRLEFRILDRSENRLDLVLRHRILYVKRANWFGSMRRIEVSNEVFFDTDSGRLSENRFRPLNLFFGLGRRSVWNVFAQLRSQKRDPARDWSNTAVLGFGLRFRR